MKGRLVDLDHCLFILVDINELFGLSVLTTMQLRI